MFKEITEIHDWLKINWYEYSSLPFIFIGVFLITYKFSKLVFSDSNIQFVKDNQWFLTNGLSITVGLLVIALWFYSRKYPVKDEGKVGIVIAIRENSPESRTIKNDVVEKFEQILSQTDGLSLFQLIILNDNHAKKINSIETAIYATDKTKSQFIVWGKSLKYGQDYEFDLHYVVRHTPLENEDKKNLMKRSFNEALTNKIWSFKEAEALPSIRTTAENIYEVALYVMGVASYLSKDYQTSNRLHTQLHQTLLDNPNKRKILGLVPEKTKHWLSETHGTLSIVSYFNGNIEEAKRQNLNALQYKSDNYSCLLHKALFEFEAGNIIESKNIIKTIRRINTKRNLPDVAWKYSEAFLLLIEGNLQRAYKIYRQALFGNTSIFSDRSVVDFNQKYLAGHPQYHELHFINGMVFQTKLGNFPMALQSFETFMRLTETDQKYLDFREKTKSKLGEIYTECRIPKEQQYK